ncbi:MULTISPECIES: hypothetical protein [unclassified Kribbella]|uniref:hypothetical protein n=1 Tax=unclassified Kribbella TaxID=2644121 RepID=UPI0033F0BE52
MIVEQATIEDLPVILAMRTEASQWLAKRGINQWAVAWPNPEAQSERILTSIRAGETWMIRTDDGSTAATVALDSFSDPQLWTPDEQAEPAMYLHRLIVRRKYAGLVMTRSIGHATAPASSATAGSASMCGPTTSASTATTRTAASNTSAPSTWPTTPPAPSSNAQQPTGVAGRQVKH